MEKKKLSPKDASIAFLVSFIISQLAIVINQMVISFFLVLANKNTSQITNFFNGPIGNCCNTIVQFLSFAGIFLYYFKRKDLKSDCIKTKTRPLIFTMFIGLGIITMFALTTFINQFSFLLNLLDKPTMVIGYSLDNNLNYFLSLFSLALLPAIGEELLFRGVILNGLKQKGKLFAIILSSIMFTIIHFSLSQLYYPLLFGLILGISYVYTENILVPISIHFVNNALNLTIQHFLKSGLFFPSLMNTIFMIVGVVVFLAILFVLLFLLSKKENEATQKLTTDSIEKLYTNETSQKTLSAKSTNTKIATSKQTKQNFSIYSLIHSEKLGFYCPLIIMFLLYIIITFVGA